MKYDFLVDTYETECLKVVSVWSEFKDDDLPVRPRQGDPRGRSVHEQMVHQCVSEDMWFRDMLGIDVGAAPCRNRKPVWSSSTATSKTAATPGCPAREARTVVGRRHPLL